MYRKKPKLIFASIAFVLIVLGVTSRLLTPKTTPRSSPIQQNASQQSAPASDSNPGNSSQLDELLPDKSSDSGAGTSNPELTNCEKAEQTLEEYGISLSTSLCDREVVKVTDNNVLAIETVIAGKSYFTPIMMRFAKTPDSTLAGAVADMLAREQAPENGAWCHLVDAPGISTSLTVRTMEIKPEATAAVSNAMTADPTITPCGKYGPNSIDGYFIYDQEANSTVFYFVYQLQGETLVPIDSITIL